MAKNENNEETKENKETKETKKKSLNPIIIIVILILVLGLGSFGGFYMFMKNNSSASTTITETKVEMFKDVTVNLSDTDSQRYLKASVTISYDAKDKKAATEITDKSVELKDKIMFFLKSKKAKDFDASNEAKLKSDLVTELNKIMTEGKIVNVYFPGDLLIQ